MRPRATAGPWKRRDTSRGDDADLVVEPEPENSSMRTQCSTGQTRKVVAFAQVSDLNKDTITASDTA